MSHPPHPVAAVLLTGGASTRMGTPKALLDYQGTTFLDRLITVFKATCDPVIVVAGGHWDQIRTGVRQAGEVQWVRNEDPSRGQISSLQCGLRLVPVGVPVLFHPVDAPGIAPWTVERLVERFLDSGAEVAIPRCDGRHGHPVLIAPEVAGELLALAPGRTARDVVHGHRAGTIYVDVDDAGVLQDIDDPAAYAALVAGSGAAGQ